MTTKSDTIDETTDFSEEGITADRLVSGYMNIRARKDELRNAYQTDKKVLDEAMQVIDTALLDMMGKIDVDSLKTSHGTVSRRINERYWTSDWESFHAFVHEHNAYDLLQRRVHSGNVQRFLEDNPDDMPVGLNAQREYVIQVRKPTAR